MKQDIQQLLQHNRDAILAAAARRGAVNVRVFGSVARGEADELSDIDLLVTFEPGVTLLGHIALERELGELLGRKVDVVSERGLRPKIKERVLREAAPL
jgi:predicted nucleotidyltransferase